MSAAWRGGWVAFVAAIIFVASPLPAQERAEKPDPSPAVRFLEREVDDRVESDGTLLRRERYRVRILTAAGLAQYSQVGVAFLEGNQEAKLESLRVTKPDGRELDLLASAPTDIAPVFPTDLPIYSDLRLLRAAVPSLAIGDLLQFESSVHSRPIAPGQVWIETEFADAETTDSQRYELNVPLNARLTVSVRAGLGARFDEERREGRWIRRWMIDRNPESSAAGETPKGVLPAAKAPARGTPDIQITTFTSWEEFGRWWVSLAPPGVDGEVDAKARALTANITEPRAQLRALYQYVTQEIRYLALPLGIGRYRAREPHEIMNTGLGDCKDKFRLLASLGESLGITIDPVLIFTSTKRAFVEEAPSPLQFDHVIARARFGTEEIWMDPTADLVPMGSLPRASRGRPGVALLQSWKAAKKGVGGGIKTALLTTPAQLPQHASVTAEVLGAIEASGLLRAKVRWTFAGDDEIYRMLFKYGDESVRRAALESLRREWSEESKLGAVTTGDPNDVDQPFWLEYEVERPMPASTWRKAWEFWVPTPFTLAEGPPSAADDSAGATPLDSLDFRSTARLRVLARIELPEGVHVSPPVAMSSRWDFAEFRSDYRFEGRTIVLERDLSFKVDAVPRAQFDELRDLRKVIASDYQQEFNVAAAPELAPAEHSASELNSDCWDAIEGKRNEEAERLCRQAIALDPRQKDAWNNLGIALERQGRPDEAKAAYEKQIEVDPRHGYAYANIGVLAWTAGDMTTAEKMLRKQVEIAPLVAFGYAHLGRLLFVNGHLDEAESSLRRAAKLDPDDTEALEDLLELTARRGRFDAFATMVSEHPALGRDLNHFAPNFTLLTRHEKANWSSLADWLRGIVSEAERTLEGLVNPLPTKAAMAAVAELAAAWEGLARAALEEGRSDDALVLMDAAIGLAHSPSAIAGKSNLLRARGETVAANRLLALAAELARPYADDFDNELAKVVPANESRHDLEARARDEAWRFRSSTRNVLTAAGDQGEIWLLFGADGRLLGATPAKDSGTKALARGLERDPIILNFPASNRARILVKALAYCSQTGECTLTLEPPGQTWMAMK